MLNANRIETSRGALGRKVSLVGSLLEKTSFADLGCPISIGWLVWLWRETLFGFTLWVTLFLGF